MASNRKNSNVSGFTMTDVVATIMGYSALLLALGALFMPIIGAYLGSLQSLMGTAMICITCTTVAIIATRLCSHERLIGMRINLDDLITFMIVVGMPAVWFFSLLSLIVINP